MFSATIFVKLGWFFSFFLLLVDLVYPAGFIVQREQTMAVILSCRPSLFNDIQRKVFNYSANQAPTTLKRPDLHKKIEETFLIASRKCLISEFSKLYKVLTVFKLDISLRMFKSNGFELNQVYSVFTLSSMMKNNSKSES